MSAPAELDDYLQLCTMIERLVVQRTRLATKIAEGMGDRDAPNSVTIPGVGILRRTKKLGKHQLEDGARMLLQDVLDSRPLDKATGELTDETPVEKIVACFPTTIHQIRSSEMERRGLKWNDYAETVDNGWSIELRKEGM